SRDELIRALDEANVESRPVWKPMHLQHLYAGCECYCGEVAKDLFCRGICLPSSSSLSEEDQLHVVNALRRAARMNELSEAHGIFALSAALAFLLRFDFSIPPAHLRHLAYALLIWIVVKSVIFRRAHLDRGWWRYVSVVDVLRIALANFAGSTLSCIAIFLIA